LADTATVTGRGTLDVDGFSEEQGLPLATSGDFLMATDSFGDPRYEEVQEIGVDYEAWAQRLSSC